MSGTAAFQWLARAGFVVKAFLYLVIGVLALQVVAQAGGRVTSKEGALMTVLGQPFGRALLLLAAIGLFGYAAWRLLQGVFDTSRDGHGWLGLWLRTTYVVRGLVHGALGVQAFRLHRGLRPAHGTDGRDLAAEALTWPFGEGLVVLAGLGLVGFAVQQIHAAVTGKLERDLDIGQLRRDAGEWAVLVSRFGIGARAIVFILLGWGAVVAGWSHDASEVGTTTTWLRTLAAQPGDWGRVLLGVTAAGFVAYAFYQAIHARYLHVRLPHLA